MELVFFDKAVFGQAGNLTQNRASRPSVSWNSMANSNWYCNHSLGLAVPTVGRDKTHHEAPISAFNQGQGKTRSQGATSCSFTDFQFAAAWLQGIIFGSTKIDLVYEHFCLSTSTFLALYWKLWQSSTLAKSLQQLFRGFWTIWPPISSNIGSIWVWLRFAGLALRMSVSFFFQ